LNFVTLAEVFFFFFFVIQYSSLSSRQVYREELQRLLGRSAPDHSSRTTLPSWRRARTVQSRYPQAPGSKVSSTLDRDMWDNCLASTLTSFKSTAFSLMGPYKIVDVIISSGWCGNSPSWKCVSFRQCATRQEFGIAFKWQWDVELRPVLRHEMNIQNVYSKAISGAECHRQILSINFQTFLIRTIFIIHIWRTHYWSYALYYGTPCIA
jgi:hypothetical protein